MPKNIGILFSILLFGALLVSCETKSPVEKKSVAPTIDSTFYLNHSDSANYVGINVCKQCHQGIFDTYLKTGMGKSFGMATKSKSSGLFDHSVLTDKFTGLHYKAYWKNDSLNFMEFLLDGHDTSFKRTEQVNYIIGSGQHTNSHLFSENGYVHQMPMTFYTQKKKWDLPPGFEEGHNTRFTRKIGLECMTCHNGFPVFVKGSENKYTSIPNGIDCERCHGPGSIHVAQRSTGKNIDTAKYVDYSIVNPAKLSVDRQFDICQRCHLQGNAIVKEGKTFYDFKPGMKLSDFITVFLPKYENADDEFIMASHADRLKQSKCFINSSKQSDPKALKPYKEALTCVTCHNPHVSVKETKNEIFNSACVNCHGSGKKSNLECSEKSVIKSGNSSNSQLPVPNCIGCHMPLSGSIDIPHVTVHDHYIRKPITKNEKEKIKKFIGLQAINEKNPDKITRARAYINHYDKFDAKPEFLDSAFTILGKNPNSDWKKSVHVLIQIYFSKQDYQSLLSYVNSIGEKSLFDNLNQVSYDNQQAWTSYRVAEAYYYSENINNALQWMKKACELAPYNLEFRNKLGSYLLTNGNIDASAREFEFILKENPQNISALTNLGYLELTRNNIAAAEKLYGKGLLIDAIYEPLLLNIAGLKAYQKKYPEAKKIIEQVLKRNPTNVKAKNVLQQLNSVIK